MNGDARFVDRGTEEEAFYREQHLENNTFSDGDDRRNWGREAEDNDGGRVSFIEDEDVRVVVVEIKDCRVSDWKGAVRDWSLVAGARENDTSVDRLVNGD
jgi:hypothetical protein